MYGRTTPSAVVLALLVLFDLPSFFFDVVLNIHSGYPLARRLDLLHVSNLCLVVFFLAYDLVGPVHEHDECLTCNHRAFMEGAGYLIQNFKTLICVRGFSICHEPSLPTLLRMY